MAAKRSKSARKTASKASNVKEAVASLKDEGHQRVLVVGQVRNGKIEIDQSKLEEFARKFPRANASFIAVNAPFDPRPLVESQSCSSSS